MFGTFIDFVDVDFCWELGWKLLFGRRNGESTFLELVFVKLFVEFRIGLFEVDWWLLLIWFGDKLDWIFWKLLNISWWSGLGGVSPFHFRISLRCSLAFLHSKLCNEANPGETVASKVSREARNNWIHKKSPRRKYFICGVKLTFKANISRNFRIAKF